jgi:hypothetical protein
MKSITCSHCDNKFEYTNDETWDENYCEGGDEYCSCGGIDTFVECKHCEEATIID